MTQNTFPAFTNMMPVVEDLQLIVDSLREEDRLRLTKDGIFTSGIVNQKDSYLSAGTDTDSLRIKPFVAYTANGNRIEIEDELDNLYAQGTVIKVTEDNKTTPNNIPYWKTYINTYENFDSSSLTESINLTSLNSNSILHGIKIKINSAFNIVGSSSQPNVYISIGTSSEPEKFLPKTLISDISSSDISVMNLMYSFNEESTDIYATYYSDSSNLNTLNNGSITISLCIATLTGYGNINSEEVDGGYQLDNLSKGTWLPNMTYHIVARYEELDSDFRQLKYTTIDGTEITTISEPTRKTPSYKLFALRKTGSEIDYTSLDDVKLGEVVTGTADDNGYGHIISIRINGKDLNGNNYTDYLTLPGYRLIENINAEQIGNGTVNNTKFNYLSNVSSDIQTQLNSKAGLASDNTFTGENTFENQIKGSIDKVNGFSAYATPTQNSLLVLDENGKIPATAISESTFSSIGNFYTVSSGVTTNGRSSFLSSLQGFNGVEISATESDPLIINYPNGAVEKITSDTTVEGLASSGYYYLVKEQNGNFVFLPTVGGTIAIIPTVSSGNTFTYFDGTGTVSGSYNNASAYKAFDGTTTTYAILGSVTYKNYQQVETTSYLPNGSTYIDIDFSNGVVPTGFAACFRKNQYDITPKSWIFEGSNDDGTTWTQLSSSTTDTWNIDEIKTIPISTTTSYTKFRFVFNLSDTTINNYKVGEQTTQQGFTMPVNCYYFQIYATNTDTSVEGKIIEGYEKPSNMSIGSYFLDISKKPYTGYKCVGNNEFVETNFVKLGFVDLVDYGGTNPSLTCYPFCYNTFTYSDNKTTYHINSGTKQLKETIAVNDTLYFDHNLGVIPNIVKVKYQCVAESSESGDSDGYSVGDYIDTMYVSDTIGLASINDSISTTITTITLRPGSSTSTLYVRHKINGNLVPTTDGRWKAIIYCSRGW